MVLSRYGPWVDAFTIRPNTINTTDLGASALDSHIIVRLGKTARNLGAGSFSQSIRVTGVQMRAAIIVMQSNRRTRFPTWWSINAAGSTIRALFKSSAQGAGGAPAEVSQTSSLVKVYAIRD